MTDQQTEYSEKRSELLVELDEAHRLHESASDDMSRLRRELDRLDADYRPKAAQLQIEITRLVKAHWPTARVRMGELETEIHFWVEI